MYQELEPQAQVCLQQHSRQCGCRGVRTCLVCDRMPSTKTSNPLTKTMFFCERCGNRAFALQLSHDQHQQLSPNNSITIDGVYVKRDAIDESTEFQLIESIYRYPWINSQSGRRKQDFGPKINFRKRKIKFEGFVGLPQLPTQVLQQVKKEDDVIGDKLKEFNEVEGLLSFFLRLFNEKTFCRFANFYFFCFPYFGVQ